MLHQLIYATRGALKVDIGETLSLICDLVVKMYTPRAVSQG